MLTTAEIAPSLRPGMHACTFGGNPIAARAGLASIEMIEQREPAGHTPSGWARCSASGWKSCSRSAT